MRRVAITGCGVVSAAGADLRSFWDVLVQGRSLIRPLRGFAIKDLPNLYGAEVDFPDEGLGADRDSRRRRCARLLGLAARHATRDARLSESWCHAARMGVAMGTTLGEEEELNHLHDRAAEVGALTIDATFASRADNTRLALDVARDHQLRGPVLLNATACSSGNAATAWAYDLVASGACDAMLAGGVDTLTRVTYSGFSRMNALSKSVCRPFDVRRDGVSFGEGAGVLVLEEMGHAQRRGAHVYAELAGYGIGNDAHHITAPEPNGRGMARAIREALTTTATSVEAIDYVSAHGTGTPYNDAAEERALRAVFGDRTTRTPVSSIKASLGHTNGAASALESVACVLALEHQLLPPTANLEQPDPAFALDLVRTRAREARVNTCLNLAAGFGGFNVCLVLKKAPQAKVRG
ncbi:MAG: beta-ketoacyl-[acyl-carrier-protein] synthase family protein [Myxococcales bacterium]